MSGLIYLMSWPDGTKYIGSKSRGRFEDGKIISETKDSPGKEYWSSSDRVAEKRKIDGNPKVQILAHCHKSEIFLCERSWLRSYNAVKNPDYLNLAMPGPWYDGALTEEAKKKIGRKNKAHAADPKTKERKRERAKQLWKDPKWVADVSAKKKIAYAKPEVKAKMSANAKKMWSNPGFRQKYTATRNDPEAKKRQSEKIKEAMNRPEVREKLREAAKRRMNDSPRSNEIREKNFKRDKS